MKTRNRDDVPKDGADFGMPASDFEELFDALWDAAVITDLSGRILESNSRAQLWYLYSKSELASRHVYSLIRDADKTLMNTILKNMCNRFILIENCSCVRKDKTSFPAEIAVVLLRRRQNQLAFFIHNVTRRDGEKKTAREKD